MIKDSDDDNVEGEEEEEKEDDQVDDDDNDDKKKIITASICFNCANYDLISNVAINICCGFRLQNCRPIQVLPL